MKKQENKKFGFEKFEVAKLKNSKIVNGGSAIPKNLTIADDDSDIPVIPLTTA